MQKQYKDMIITKYHWFQTSATWLCILQALLVFSQYTKQHVTVLFDLIMYNTIGGRQGGFQQAYQEQQNIDTT